MHSLTQYNFDFWWDTNVKNDFLWKLADEWLYLDEWVSAYDVDRVLRQLDSLVDLWDDAWDLAGSEYIRQVYEEMWFDWIILKNAEEQFSNMWMNPWTTHYVAFQPEQIKSTKNKWMFDPKNPNIYYWIMWPSTLTYLLSDKQANK